MIRPGTRLGRYEILSTLGKGGMGEVWRARDTTLGRDVAIKTLPAEFANDAERLTRFEREAKLLASLNHPHIAGIYGLEEDAGTRFLVLELVEGPTLADRLRQGAIPLEESLNLALQISEALEAAHEKGVIHRDLKPANVKLTPDGQAKVLDFGLAKAFDGETADANVLSSPTLSMAATRQGIILGTAAYMSPEQAKGLPADKRADVFAFGCVLYEMLAGRQTFDGELATEVMAHVISQEPDYGALGSDLHPDIERLVRRCLAKKPGDRYRDIGDVRYEIRRLIENADALTGPPAPAAIDSASGSKRFWIAAVVIVGVLSGVAGWLFRTPAEPLPNPVIRFDHEFAEGVALRNTGRKSVAITDDGRLIAYNASDGVHLLSLDSFESRIIPGTESVRTNLTFSPDGRSLAYWVFDGRLEKISINGGAPVVLAQVARNPQGLDWAADDTLVYSDAGTLMRVSANAGVPAPLLAGGSDRSFLPHVLPGGGAVLYTSRTEVFVQALDAEEPRMLFAGTDPRYLTTGHIVYVVDGALYAHAFDLESLEPIGGPASLVESISGNPDQVSQYAVADSGTLVYVPGGSGSGASRTLVWVDREGNETALETLPAADYGNPRLSPNGERVLVYADGDLSIYDMASGRRTPVTTDGTTNSLYYAWSPEGDNVAYTSSRGGNSDAWIQPADDSGEAFRLTQHEATVDVDSFSPGGDFLAVHDHGSDGGTDILMIPLVDGTAESGSMPPLEPFLTTEFGENNTQFSPDGRFVAFVSYRSGGPQIYIRPFPGPGPTETVSIDGGVEPVWARNGDLFYRHPVTHAMMGVEVQTEPELVPGIPELVFEAGQYVGYSGGSPSPVYDVSSDGQRFLMLRDSAAAAATDDRPRVNVVVHWFEEVKARVPVE